jgi:plastocyanin
MTRLFTGAGLAAMALALSACGGYGGPSPVPDGPTAPPEGAIVINIVGIDGGRSFSPNPSTVPPGQTVAWHNVDSTTHRVVLNNGALDTGNIAPGRFSAPMTLTAPVPYHCSIHPEMVGTIASAK